jgi:TRAP-type mannitol/chloroaromatic compound transport system substrate-binding protein
MKRREFLKKATALTAAGASASLLSGCNKEQATATGAAVAQEKIEWKMVTTWPKNFPGLGTGANKLAALIGELSGGRLTVKVYGAGELVPAFEIFDYVGSGSAQMGHGAAYYWKGKIPGAQIFSSVPFGFNAQEMNAWVYHGGGLEIWQKMYAPHGLVPMPAGNMGVQMGGWFNKEINSAEDLNGLKMRIPGLGGEVLKRLGGTPVNLPGGELFTALQTGALDATEWVGPYNDLAFGFHKVAKYYYYPGWHEPGTALEVIVNQEALESLPADLQAIVKYAAQIVNADMLAEYTARNNAALKTLLNEHGVELRKFPEPLLKRLKDESEIVAQEMSEASPLAKEAYNSFIQFRKDVFAWHEVSEAAIYRARN